MEWFTCSPTGVLAVADPVVDFQFDTRFDSKALVPRASQYFYQFCPDDVSQALVKAMGPSTITVQGYLQGATTAPANSLATFPLSISSKQPEFVVGISIKAKDPIDAYFKGEVEVSLFVLGGGETIGGEEGGRREGDDFSVCVCVYVAVFFLPFSPPPAAALVDEVLILTMTTHSPSPPPSFPSFLLSFRCAVTPT